MNTLMSLGDCEPKCCGEERSMLQVLQERRAHLQSQINDVEAAITALEQNPAIVNVLELIRKVQRF